MGREGGAISQALAYRYLAERLAVGTGQAVLAIETAVSGDKTAVDVWVTGLGAAGTDRAE